METQPNDVQTNHNANAPRGESAKRGRTVLILSALLVAGLAAVIVMQAMKEAPVEKDPPANTPPAQKDRPFEAATEVTIVKDTSKIIGINFQGKGFYIAPKPDGKGWYYHNLASLWDVDAGYVSRLLHYLRQLPVSPAEGYTPTPLEVKITLEGEDNITFNIGEPKPEPDMTPVFIRIGNGNFYRISAAHARLLYPTESTMLGATPTPTAKIEAPEKPAGPEIEVSIILIAHDAILPTKATRLSSRSKREAAELATATIARLKAGGDFAAIADDVSDLRYTPDTAKALCTARSTDKGSELPEELWESVRELVSGELYEQPLDTRRGLIIVKRLK